MPFPLGTICATVGEGKMTLSTDRLGMGNPTLNLVGVLRRCCVDRVAMTGLD